MASLTNTKISDTYPLLLKIETNGVDGTLRSIEDGDGTTSALKISSGAIQVDNIKIDGNVITSTDSNCNIDLTPDGSGEVNISKVDIDSGAIDGTAIGGGSASTGAFTTISASGNVDFNGDLDVDGTTNLDAVDIDGNVDIAGTFAVSHSSDFGSFTSTLQSPILKLNSTYGSAAGSGYIDFQRDGTTAARIYQINQELRLASGGTTDALTLDSSQDATFASWVTVTEGLIVNESGGDNDVRMESQNNDNMFRLDASTDRIGIGTGSPDNNVHIVSTSSETGMIIQSNLGGTGSAVDRDWETM